MKSLGEQVADFMAQEGISSGAMGVLVGTSRQNIENLVAGAVGNPRYLRRLAEVMRTSADVLLDGLYVYVPPGAEPQSASAPGMPWPLRRWTPEQWAAIDPYDRGAMEDAAMAKLRELEAERQQSGQLVANAHAMGSSRKRPAAV